MKTLREAEEHNQQYQDLLEESTVKTEELRS